MKYLLLLLLAGLAIADTLPRFSYGAVYFRKTNPPREDWERDYAQASKDGMNTFRHWFMWGAIEVEPGKFDWADYDAQLDLAAKYGIKTVIAEVIHSAPEWAFPAVCTCAVYGSGRQESLERDAQQFRHWRLPGLMSR